VPTLHFDLHVHTAASHDGTGAVDQVLDQADRVGLDGLAITDHDAIDAARRAARLAPGYDLIVLPGVEVSTAAGHVLAIGVGHRPPAGTPFADTVSRIRSSGGVAVVPHPGQRTRHGVRPSRIENVDAVETYNALRLTGLRNRRSKRLAERRGYPAVGGSDAHAPDSVGQGFTAVSVPPGEATPAGVLAALRAGRVAPRGNGIQIRRYLRRFLVSAGRKTATVPRVIRTAVR